jgi:hypothetical protein
MARGDEQQDVWDAAVPSLELGSTLHLLDIVQSCLRVDTDTRRTVEDGIPGSQIARSGDRYL